MAKKAVAKLPYPAAFIADVHLGNFREFGGLVDKDGLNARGKLTIETLEQALARAVKLGCAQLFVAGDLFEHRRPEPAVIAACNRVFAKYDGVFTIDIIPGNHDELDATALHGNTACEVVAEQANVLRGWEDIVIGGLPGQPGSAWARCVPFEASKPMAQFLEEVCTNFKAKEGVRVLVTHVGVVDDSSPPFLKAAPDAIHADRLFTIMEREDIKAAFVGNYHQAQRWERSGRVIQQIGVLNPRGFGDAGLDRVGGLVTWDGVEVRWGQVPGPRFLELEHGAMPPVETDCTVFTRERAAREVAAPVELSSAKLATSADEAVARWAAEAPLPEGVTREELVTKINATWKAAT